MITHEAAIVWETAFLGGMFGIIALGVVVTSYACLVDLFHRWHDEFKSDREDR